MYVNVCMYTTYNMYMGTHIYIIYIWTHIYLSHVSGLYIFIYDVCMHKYIYNIYVRALSDFDGVFLPDFGTKSINRDNFRTNPNPSL
jgi:hypothetical protein